VSGVPILLEAVGLPVLVVGAGSVAARKAGVFCASGAVVRVVAPEVGEAVRALADAGRLTLVERRFERGDVGHAVVVIAATDDRAVNALVAREAREGHRLVNVADGGGDGTFSTMATHRAGGLVVGVGAGVPAAAARIRDAIAERFDDRYARALADLAELRDRLLAEDAGGRWRQLSSELLGGAFCEAVDAETFDGRLDQWR
jgi:precorrin-2 dehydrogenase/sirohydrochlorin ferrochelatase